LLTSVDQIRLIDGSPGAIGLLKQSGFRVIVVTNQTVIARGLLTEAEVAQIHQKLQEILQQVGGEPVDAYYVCPHHPNANLPIYRINCNCRKPKPGLLFKAAADWEIDLNQSWMVGDRPSDLLAGKLAWCRTILVESGMHTEPPIESDADLTTITPDHVCKNLFEAVRIITEGLPG
jgi:D-glycero-D-manno-heptose 1,7-bisphosphate phosphatase